MTTGTTALQVSPSVPTEEEMGKVKDLFGRAIDSIVAHAHISREVAELSAKVDSLSSDLERYKGWNASLDRAVTETRRERDEAREQVRISQAEIEDLRTTVSASQREIETLKTEVRNYSSALTTRIKERDEAQFKNLELEEALNLERTKVAKVQAEMARFREAFDNLLGGAQAMQTAPEVAQPSDPSQPSETTTGGPTAPASSGSEGQSEARPSDAEGGGADTSEGQREPSPTAPGPTPGVHSAAESDGTGKPDAGDTQAEGESLSTILPSVPRRGYYDF